jgi:hypothetical protein
MEGAMTTRVRIRIGPIEVEYEGNEDFLRQELPNLISTVSSLYYQSGLQLTPSDQAAIPTRPQAVGRPQVTVPTATTATIAEKLNCKTGPDLITAAAAHLTFVEQKDRFTRQEIIDDMKTATAYFKKSYVNNLSNYLKNLVRDEKLVEVRKDTYALKAETRKELEQQLVE